MTSILTNTGAMNALQSLRSTNQNLAETQSQISSGKKVGSASDNAAVWSVSKTMESDVKAFNKINESLNKGGSTVAVAADAADTVRSLLDQMREKIVGAQNADNDADRAKIQQDIDSYKDQIKSAVSTAQFNGVNLVNGSKDELNVMSALDRGSDGRVTAQKINVVAQNLSTKAGEDITGALTNTSTGGVIPGDATAVTFETVVFGDADGGTTGTQAISRSDLNAGTDPAADGLMAGDVIKFTIGNAEADGAVEGVDYLTVQTRVNAGDFESDVATNMKRAIDEALSSPAAKELNFDDAGVTAEEIGVTVEDGQLVVTNNDGGGGGGEAIGSSLQVVRDEGKMANLEGLDVTTATGADSALQDIDGMIKTAIDATAAFGTYQNQIETQSNFVSKLTDNLEAGIGSLVDADMEETSARLQALQTQQQLGIQALSIANQSSQSVLSLFR